MNAAAIVLWVFAGTSPSPAEQAKALVTSFNHRDLGSPGLRRVRIDLMNGVSMGHSFDILNAWIADGDSVRSIFFLNEPRELRGVSYFQEELFRGFPGLSIVLYLPMGLRMQIRVDPADSYEGLLGSDFTYQDLRLLIDANYSYRLAGDAILLGHPCHLIEMLPKEAHPSTRGWDHSVIYLARDVPLVLGWDFYTEVPSSPDSRVLVKQMRVLDIGRVDGFWTPTRMLMSNRNGNKTLMSLKEVHFHHPAITPDLFSEAALVDLEHTLSKLPEASSLTGGSRDE